ncbi:Wings apart-like protein heterochromatin [Rhizoctonia solani]|uniref:Wings apart-like protein heterochromatin n=1 Tax=Rhizoctonia solani TaxID=456999 RepID=A0A8H7IAI9_9AGAM|nr:Wings apart-like protein heterochromatin [Rhizoctonia solani]
MPVTSRSTKRKKPPRIDSDQSSNESTASEDEKRGLPPKVARPPEASSRDPLANTVLGSGSRTATPPRDKEDSQRDSASTPNLGSQSQSNKHDTPSQTKKSIEGSMSTASATLGMSAPRRTYSQVRSFLAPIEDLDPDLNSSTLSIPRLTSTQSYNDLLQSESQEELQQDTITEMRVKGESRRFGDDIEYVLEGWRMRVGSKCDGLGKPDWSNRRCLVLIAPSSLKCLSAVEFVTRMHEKGFVLRARASDVLGRAWRAIHQSVLEAGDRVFDAIAAIFICLVARELQDVAGALQDSKLPSTFCFILNRARDFDGLEAAASDSSWAMYADVAKRAGVGKVERKQLCALLGLCQNIKLTPTGQVVTTRLLISHGMSLLVPRPTTRSLLLDIIASTSAYMDVFDTRLLGYSTGLNELSIAIDQYEPSDEDEESGLLGKEVEEFSNRVATLCRVCQILMTSDPEDLESGGTGFSISAPAHHTNSSDRQSLRFPDSALSDVENPGLAYERSTPPVFPRRRTWDQSNGGLGSRNPLNFHIITHFVAKGGDPSTQSTQFEHACLGLALLLNLVKEGSVGVKQSKPYSCPLNRKCSTECQCKNRKPLLNLYVGMYGQLQNESALQADFHATFLAGYLAVLLGLLVVNDESVKDGVYEELPGPAGSNKFEDLAQSIEQFVHAYEKVAQATKIRTNRDEEDDDNNDDNEDKEVGGGDAGSGIALGVAKRLREIS